MVYVALIFDKHCVTLLGENGTFLIALTGDTNEFVKSLWKKMIGDYINNKTFRNNHQVRVESIPRCYYAVCEFFLMLLMLLHKVFFLPKDIFK